MAFARVGRCPSQGPATVARTCSAVPPQQRKRRAGRRPRGCSSRQAACLLVATSCAAVAPQRCWQGLRPDLRQATGSPPVAGTLGSVLRHPCWYDRPAVLELRCATHSRTLHLCRSSKLRCVRSGGLEPNAYTLLSRSYSQPPPVSSESREREGAEGTGVACDSAQWAVGCGVAGRCRGARPVAVTDTRRV